jgi:dihydroorotase
VPPLTTVFHTLQYQKVLEEQEPNVHFLMSLYLHPNITPQTVIEAKRAGISGIKSYPHGVTTNSGDGVLSYEEFYPVFEEMQRQDMVLNLHGELPPSAGADITVLNAEEAFLPTLLDLHRRFPNLRIVLEHCTTAAAIEAVKSCADNVVGTITAHHLWITVDDWAGDPHCFCKPVAKSPADRRALLDAAVSGHPKFFLGTDSAPHPATAKRNDKVAAGVFTQPYAVGLIVHAFEVGVEKGFVAADDVTVERLEAFLSKSGRAFYKLADEVQERIVLRKDGQTIAESLKTEDGSLEVVPFRRGKVTWRTSWV